MKKVLSLVLALVMVLGMTTVAFASQKAGAALGTDTDAYDWAVKSSNKAFKLFLSNGADDYRFPNTLTVTPNADENKITLTGAGVPEIGIYMLDKATRSTAFADYSAISKQRAEYFDIEIKLASSSSVFAGAGINNDGTVKLDVYTYLDSTSSRNFDDKITIFANGKRISDSDFTLKGKFENGKQTIEDEDDNELDLADGAARRIEVKANVRGAELELDNNLYIYTTLYNGRNVYARSNNRPSNLQMAVLDKYGFDDVVNLSAIGFTGSTEVKFDHPENLYIYGVDASSAYDAVADSVKLVYLGRSNDKLPMVGEYYLSTKEITLVTEAPAEEPPVDADNSAPVDENPVGGGNTSDANVNYNPGTGC